MGIVPGDGKNLLGFGQLSGREVGDGAEAAVILQQVVGAAAAGDVNVQPDG